MRDAKISGAEAHMQCWKTGKVQQFRNDWQITAGSRTDFHAQQPPEQQEAAALGSASGTQQAGSVLATLLSSP